MLNYSVLEDKVKLWSVNTVKSLREEHFDYAEKIHLNYLKQGYLLNTNEEYEYLAYAIMLKYYPLTLKNVLDFNDVIKRYVK